MKIRVVDLETTGLSAADGARVCEIGWCDLDDGIVGKPDFRLVNPGVPMPPEAEVDKGFLEWMLTKSDFDADTIHSVKWELNRRKSP